MHLYPLLLIYNISKIYNYLCVFSLVAPRVESMDKRIPAEEGSMTTIRCLVSGHPEPRVLWYRDRKLREPITRGPEYDLNMKPYRDVRNIYYLCISSFNY